MNSQLQVRINSQIQLRVRTNSQIQLQVRTNSHLQFYKCGYFRKNIK
jgi:hypothetical protein